MKNEGTWWPLVAYFVGLALFVAYWKGYDDGWRSEFNFWLCIEHNPKCVRADMKGASRDE